MRIRYCWFYFVRNWKYWGSLPLFKENKLSYRIIFQTHLPQDIHLFTENRVFFPASFHCQKLWHSIIFIKCNVRIYSEVNTTYFWVWRVRPCPRIWRVTQNGAVILCRINTKTFPEVSNDIFNFLELVCVWQMNWVTETIIEGVESVFLARLHFDLNPSVWDEFSTTPWDADTNKGSKKSLECSFNHENDYYLFFKQLISKLTLFTCEQIVKANGAVFYRMKNRIDRRTLCSTKGTGVWEKHLLHTPIVTKLETIQQF